VLKSNPAAPPRFFEAEAEGLQALSQSGTPLAIPTVVVRGDDVPAFLVLQDLGSGTPTRDFDERLGRGLAALHRHQGDAFGFSRDNFCGLTPQPNPWTDRWVEFYATSRLGFQLQRASDAGLLSSSEVAAIDGVIARLDRWLDEPADGPALIHGDLWSGNVHVTRDGQPFRNGFHTYRVDWEPNSITWYVDGVQYQRRTPADLNGKTWVYNHPFFMIMNVAVGGYWPGYPDGSTVMPQTMTVDYVRVSDVGGSSGGSRITGLAGKCLDVAAASTADGTPVQLYDCNGTGAQQWTRPGDGTIRALGKCLDVNAGSVADGAKVQLWTCNGTGAQQWTYSAAHDLVNPQANKCLDVTGNNSANATPVQTWTCTGAANQKWTV